MVSFAHIAPTPLLQTFVNRQKNHLLLAHLVESDEKYATYYNHHWSDNTYILDNSAFEMYKQGRPMYPSDKLIEMGKRVKADYVVMSDYPNERGLKTIKAAEQLAPLFKEQGFGTFFVPPAGS